MEQSKAPENILIADRLESIERHRQIVAYLFAAHGAGLAACLSTLKDMTPPLQLKGIGFFIDCFAIGFLLAVIAYVARVFQFEHARAARFDGKPDIDETTRALTRVYLYCAALSAAVLVVVLIAVIVRFHGL
ncbi:MULTISPECIES: hypothetical protein [unclassified Bradyrhizobium]|uniref:hypothetical protein n=1 Tax=unclassified Bradyrhizobium TaxID=2631580 RepID=UPI0024B1F769|nr:hypothetical protein [Bradyrhizobium sp. CB2312]WFU68745.1 hypothetical protein QA642_25870 [Bradyrhizobium sp. CB2312]